MMKMSYLVEVYAKLLIIFFELRSFPNFFHKLYSSIDAMKLSKLSTRTTKFWRSFLFFHYLKVLFVDSTDGYGVASKIEDELTVTVDTDDVSLASFENACEHT